VVPQLARLVESGISKLLADGAKADAPAALILNPGQPGTAPGHAPLGELARKAATYGLRGDALARAGARASIADGWTAMTSGRLTCQSGR